MVLFAYNSLNLGTLGLKCDGGVSSTAFDFNHKKKRACYNRQALFFFLTGPGKLLNPYRFSPFAALFSCFKYFS